MEPPTGILSSLWRFILFIPYFTALLFLGLLKGINFHLNFISFEPYLMMGLLPFLFTVYGLRYKSNFVNIISWSIRGCWPTSRLATCFFSGPLWVVIYSCVNFFIHRSVLPSLGFFNTKKYPFFLIEDDT